MTQCRRENCTFTTPIGGKGAFMSGENNGTAQTMQQVDSSATGENQPAGGSQQTYTFDELNAHTDRVVKERIDKV